jgi:hypothetical protein
MHHYLIYINLNASFSWPQLDDTTQHFGTTMIKHSSTSSLNLSPYLCNNKKKKSNIFLLDGKYPIQSKFVETG